MATKKQTKIVPTENGPFLTGLSIGLFAGAFGYYLFNTSRGEQMRESLSTEWQSIRKKMYEEGLIPSPDLSLSEVLSDHLSTLSAWFGKIAELEQKETKKSASQTKSDRFKGV